MKDAFALYCKEVQEGTFPGAEHEYGISEEIIERLY